MRLLAASARPVSALVKPGPWWTVQTPTRPLHHGQADEDDIVILVAGGGGSRTNPNCRNTELMSACGLSFKRTAQPSST